MTEYEIKISKADFKKDWDKKADLFTIDRTNLKGYTTEEVTKHQHIQAGKHCNRFYFVCPAELIQPAEVPDGYGLIWVTKRVEQWGTIFTFKVVKRSKLWRQEGQPLELFRHLAVNIGIKYCNVKAKLMRYQQAHKNSTKTNPAGE